MFSSILLVSTFLYNVNSQPYEELTEIEVCSITSDGSNNLDGIFDGSYSIDAAGSAAWTGSNGARFGWNTQNNDYRFEITDATHGDIILKLMDEKDQRELFQLLYTASSSNSGCSCGSNSVSDDTYGTNAWRLEQENGFGNPSVELCATWSGAGTIEFVSWDSETQAADLWHCNRQCEALTDVVSVSYQGFEVFSDSNCQNPRRNNDDGTWRCSPNGCIDGYYRFRRDLDVADLSQFKTKCQSCTELFGDTCANCERRVGCQQCDGTPGYGIIAKTNDCDWQYCGEECCQEDLELTTTSAALGGELETVPVSEDQRITTTRTTTEGDRRLLEIFETTKETDEECVEEGPVGGGSGSTDYDCRSDAERRAGVSGLAGIYGVRYTLPDPITNPVDGCDLDNLSECRGDCENNVPYKCPGTDENCAQIGDFDGCNDNQPFDLRGCAVCQCSVDDPRRDVNSEYYDATACVDVNDEYWWFSNAVPCVSCGAIENCVSCQNGGDYGGGGCSQCEDGYHGQYDDDIGVYYCEANVPSGTPTQAPSQFGEPGDDGWEGLVCPEPCGDDERYGERDHCFCGCECNTCDEDDVIDSESNCDPASCEYHSGCGKCLNDDQDSTNDYWMKSPDYNCLNCADTFGTRCSFCNDYMGCAQCEPGYLHTYSNCCEIWYCKLAPTNQ